MRLIDANKLLKFFTVDTANQTYRFGTVKKQIESAPTVQAIPLNKVEETKEEIGNYDVLNNFASSTEAFKLGVTRGLDLAVEILDKLIKESEG